MKRVLLLGLLALAACSKAPIATQPAQAAEADQPLPAGGEMLYKFYLDQGMTPKAAKDAVIADARPSEADKKRAAAHAAQREDEIAQVRASACKADPGIDYC